MLAEGLPNESAPYQHNHKFRKSFFHSSWCHYRARMTNCQEPAKLLILNEFFVAFLQQHGRRGRIPGREKQEHQPDKFTFLVYFISS